jgi:hypothetical protein
MNIANLYSICNLSGCLITNTYSQNTSSPPKDSVQKIFNQIADECGLNNIPCKIAEGSKARAMGNTIQMSRETAYLLTTHSLEARRLIVHELAHIYHQDFAYRIFVKTAFLVTSFGINYFTSPHVAINLLQVAAMLKLEQFIEQRIEQRAQNFTNQHFQTV